MALCQTGSVRREKNKKPSLTLQFISLRYSHLYPFLKQYIEKSAKEYPIFKEGFGYVTIRYTVVNNYSRAPVEVTKENDEKVDDWMDPLVAQFSVSLESLPFMSDSKGDCWLCSDHPLIIPTSKAN
ncbi:MAG: hypothetical protein QM669_05120 [Siphonobacter sp.]